MEIARYISILRQYWWVILLAALAAGAAAAVLSATRTPVYGTQARVVVRPAPGLPDERTVVDLLGQIGLRYVPGTYAEAFTSDEVKARARSAVGLSGVAAGDYELSAVVLPDTLVIEVTGSGPDPVV